MRLTALIYKPSCRGAGIGLICALLCWWLNGSASVRVLEDWALDNSFVIRGPRSTATRVVVVGIDEASLTKLGKPLLLISPELAQVVAFLREQGAAAIGVDLLLPEQEATLEYLLPGQPGDAETMGLAVNRAGNVTLPAVFLPEREPLLPIYEWRHVPPGTWQDFGYVNFTVDADTYMRRQTLRARDGQGRVFPAMGLALFGRARELDEDWFGQPRLELGNQPIPVDRRGRLRINFVGPPGTIERLLFADVLAAAQGAGSLDCDLHGAIVIVGSTGDAQPDRHATPYLNQSLARLLRTQWLGHEPQEMTGPEIHANLVATLADRAFIRRPWWLSTPLLLVIAGTGLGAIYGRASLLLGAAIAVSHHVVWRGLCLAAFCCADWHVEMVAMSVLGVLVYGALFTTRMRWMRRMLGMVKSEAIARALEADPGRLKLIGEQRHVSILFSDVRNFTPFSEQHTPQEVVRLLNEYFTAIVPCIERRGGTIAQYNGDGVMVVFGAPEPQADHADRAVESAVAMVRRVHQLGERWKALDAESFRIGVGVHSGPAVVGAVGSPRRLDYTAHGDTVNTAARIEAANKQLGTEILISEKTFDSLSAAWQSRLGPAATVHRLAVKGKQELLSVRAVEESAVADGLPLTRQSRKQAWFGNSP